MTMFQTEWKKYSEQGQRYRMRVKYGLDYGFAKKYDQAPHFSITMESERQARNNHWYEDGAGAAHDQIARRFPELARLIKWHSFALVEGPMHYLANAKYWWEIARGLKPLPKYTRGDPWAIFESTIVYGALPGEESGADADRRYAEVTWPKVEEWLRTRLPQLNAEFEADMAAIGALE